MEEKYKKFQEFDWQNSKEWQLYYSNLYPTPPPSKILRYKKKFYRNKIDSDFDIDYIPPSENTNNSSSNSTYNSTSNSTNYNYNSNNYDYNSNSQYQTFNTIPKINNPILLQSETLFFAFFFAACILTFLFPRGILTIAYLIRMARFAGMPKFNMEYVRDLLQCDVFFPLVTQISTCMDRFNYYVIFPQAIFAIIALCENLQALKFDKFQEYRNWVLNNRQKLIICKGHAEVGVGILLIFGAFARINSFLTIIVYWQFLRVKYIMVYEINNSFRVINAKLNDFKGTQICPAPVKSLINGVQWLCDKYGKIDTQAQQQQGSPGMGCQIF